MVADYVHAILEADRTVYAKHIVNRLQKKNIIYASENWWEENTLLLPAQFLLNASDLIKNMRFGLDYKLISLWPINPHNGAANQFEHTAKFCSTPCIRIWRLPKAVCGATTAIPGAREKTSSGAKSWVAFTFLFPFPKPAMDRP